MSCSLTNLQQSNTGTIVNDRTVANITPVPFKLKKFESSTTTLYDVVNTKEIYDRVTIEVKLYNLKEVNQHVYGKILEGVAIDNSNITRNISFFGTAANMVKDQKSYKITDVMIGSYLNKKNLKVSTESDIQELTDDAVVATISENASQISICGKICSIDSSSVKPRYTCQICSHEVTIDEHLAICKPCDIVGSASEASQSSDLIFTISQANAGKIDLICPHSLIQPIFKNIAVNVQAFYKEFINSDIMIKYKKEGLFNKVVSIEKCITQES